MWELINDITGKNTSQKTKITNIIFKNGIGEPISDKKCNPNNFNKYFNNIGTEMAKNIENLPEYFLKDTSQQQSIFLKPVTQNELIEIISKLKTNYSSDPDGISS